MLLAWASPYILRVSDDGNAMPLVHNSSWLLLLAGAPIVFALRQLTRCLPRVPASVWCVRLAAAALAGLALDACGFSIIVTSLASTALPNNYNFARSVWPTTLVVILAAAAIPASFVLALAARDCGLTRAASRLWRLTFIGAAAATVLQIWSREGHRFATDPPTHPSGGPAASRALHDAIYMSTAFAQYLAPLLIVTLALTAWHAAALACAQLRAVPPTGPSLSR